MSTQNSPEKKQDSAMSPSDEPMAPDFEQEPAEVKDQDIEEAEPRSVIDPLRRAFVVHHSLQGGVYTRAYPKNFKKTWKEFQKALQFSEDFSFMWFLTLCKVLEDCKVAPSDDTPPKDFIIEVAIRQALVLLHPYNITTNKLLVRYLRKNGILLKS